MRRFMICFILMLGLLLGCGKKVSYNFLHNQSEISTIEIIEVGEADEQGVNEKITLCTIDDKDAFLEGFNQLDCYKHIGDPIGVEPTKKAIKIIYINGEYELISSSGIAHYTKEKQYKNYIGLYSFDREPFNHFLSSYIDEQ